MKFTHEYSKLSKKVFTTIRKNTNFYKIGRICQVQTPEQSFKAKVVGSRLIEKAMINDCLAQEDADMNAKELIVLLEKWYGKKFDDFVLLTLKKWSKLTQ